MIQTKNTNEPTIENALYSALDSRTGDEEKWQALRESGTTDADLTAAIGEVFGRGGESTVYGGFEYRGGKSPQFTWFDDGPRHKAQKLTGKRLLAKVREVMEIGAPGMSSKSLVDPAALCVCGHRSDAHAPFNSPDKPPQECVDCNCDSFVDVATAPAAVKMLRDADADRLHKEALARWRRDPGSKADDAPSNGYHPQMLRMIPLGRIEPSPTNPRKHFDMDKLQELANSIIEHGLVEPILVRPVKQSYLLEDAFQLVAGERRWRAAKLAGLTEIEAKVRELDDKAVLEIQFIENLQRADLSPVEEAEGYKRLLDEHGYTAESLAGKLGKSKSYVYARLKICNLPPAAADMVLSGDLPATVAELIGRLPNMEMREEFWEDNFGGMGKDWFQMPSFRDVKLTIESDFMKELKGAPFDQKDAKLLPEAGSCAKCPFRTGNNKAEYPGSRADICTKPACYEMKVEAVNSRKLEAAATEGVRVLTDAEVEKFLSYGMLRGELARDYVDLADYCDEAVADEDWETDAPSFAELLGDAVKVEVVGMTKGGTFHQLVSRKAAAEFLAGKGIELKDPVPSNPAALYKNEQKRQKELRQVRQQASAEVVTEALRGVDDSLFTSDKFLRLVAKFLVDKGDAEIARAIAKRREMKYDAADVRGSVAKAVDGLDGRGVLELIVEWMLGRELEYWSLGMGGEKFPLSEYFGLKPKAVEKRVAGELKAKEKEKAKRKPGAKPKLVIQA